LGKDTRGNNLAVYNDGHSYCFSCRYYVASPTTVTNLKSKLYKQSLAPSEHEALVLGQVTYAIPPTPAAWLSSYGITPDEIHHHNICWNPEKESLVFPIYNGEQLVAYSSRYFGSRPEHPRYINRSFRRGHFKLFPKASTSVFILVEDYVSAIKVGRHFNAIPILGSFVPLDLILSLVYQQPQLRIWLDRDKALEAIKYSNRARQFIPDCATIITDNDPKDYTDKEITEIVSGSLKSVPQLGSVQ
jgi:hypothetical protein